MSTVTEEITELSLVEPMFRLAKDMRAAARDLSKADARWFVDRYYEVQEDRKRAVNQRLASSDIGEPCKLVDWSCQSITRYEASLKAALGEFARSYRVGAWMQSLCGIGPVISAGMLVNFDISKAPTVGHFWRFAGADPTLKWPGREGAKKIVTQALADQVALYKAQERTDGVVHLTPEAIKIIHDATGQHAANIQRVFSEGYAMPKGKPKTGRIGLETWLAKRPWNGNLKALCMFRLGETQVKFCNHKLSYYGPLYTEYKAALEKQNEAGDFAVEAKRNVEEKTVGKTTDAWKAYSAGRLPQGQIHNRARRWMVKLFLSHLHHVMYEDFHGKVPPHPYIFDHPNGEDHHHLLLPPNWDDRVKGRALKELE